MTAKNGEMNVTPMIDVLLVLIIIFLVISPDRSAGLEARIPQPANGKSRGSEIVVSVGEDRSVSINTQPVSWEDLEPRLRTIFAARPDAILFVSGARKAEYQDVARVFDTARGAGIARVALMSKHP
jgi:biopolymer transport protein ExbD